MSLKPRNIDFHETWTQLKETVKGVVALNKISRAVWNNRFSDVYALCVAQPESLAERLYDETKNFLEEHVSTLLERVKSHDLNISATDDDLLNRYYDAWMEYSQGVCCLNNLYSYLNLQFVKKHKLSEAEIVYGGSAGAYDVSNPDNLGKLEVGELGLLIWERFLVRKLAPGLTSRILTAYCASRENRECCTPESVLKVVIHSFVEVQSFRIRNPLSLYQEIVENPLLAYCENLLSIAAVKWLERNDISQFMKDVLDGQECELRLCARLLHSSSKERVRECYERATVVSHLQELHEAAPILVQEQRAQDLNSMYRLLKPLPNNATRPLVEAAAGYVEKEGRKALAQLDPENAHVQFVDAMLHIHTKYKQLYAEVFLSDQAFMGALDIACSTVINARPAPDQPCRSPELLAKFCDSLLRKRNPDRAAAVAGDIDIDERLSAAIVVFKYIDDKDVFQKYYARALAKRLIYQLSASMDYEEVMINKLKQACGYEFTNKLHRMFTDIAVSADLNSKFHAHLRTQGHDLGIGLSIQVLQAGAWHLGGTGCASLAPPEVLVKACSLFEQFYSAAYSGRRLTWLHHLCAGELRTRYTPRPHLIAAAAPQCSALLAFQTQDRIAAGELRQALQMQADSFSRHIKGLLDIGLLTVEGNIDGDEETAQLVLNLTFTSKRTRVRVACAPAAPRDVEREPPSVDDDRKMYLQAAIVRIMKAKKVLRHNELIQEVVGQARSSFAPSVSMIKKCIEALIDKQYLERAAGHSDQYSYVA